MTSLFFEIHSALPREAPGDDASTVRALALAKGLPPKPDILDVGCGPGAQTLVLARATGGLVTAVDNNAPYLDDLRRRAELAVPGTARPGRHPDRGLPQQVLGRPAGDTRHPHHGVLECRRRDLSRLSRPGSAHALGRRGSRPRHGDGAAEIDAVFMTAYRILRKRIEAFFALPLTELAADPTRLKAAMDRIGTLAP